MRLGWLLPCGIIQPIDSNIGTCLYLWIKTQRIWNRWNWDWGRCWLRLWNPRFSPSQFGVIGENSFIFQHFCTWTLDNITSRFYMGDLPMKPKFNANINCVMSLRWGRVRWNVAELYYYHRIPTIQVGQHLTTTYRLLICPPRPQKSSMS